jgi:hypothetical protein
LGPSLPPAELARWDSVFFVKIKCLFSFAPETRKGGESFGVRNTDQTRLSVRPNTVVRPVNSSPRVEAAARGRVIGASDPPRDRSVRLQTLGAGAARRRERTRWRVRSPLTGHVRSCLELSGTSLCSFLGRSDAEVARPIAHSVDGISSATSSRSNARARPVVLIGVSDLSYSTHIMFK